MVSSTHELWDNRLLSQIITAMADGVFTLDKDGRISSWNPAMERITGYSSSEVLGHTCSILQCSRCFGKDCPNGFKACGILTHGKGEDNECFVRHRDGHDVPVIKSARAVRDERGEIIGIVETLTDMTELNKARKKVEEAYRRLGEKFRFDNIIGKSRAMQQVFAAIEAAAASNATVLIQGESGTGKELVASAIHFNSLVKDGPFVVVNCSALPETLLESELFGHAKGSFTGAIRDRKGRFEEADGGTIFLDEIGELTPLIQVKLLRVLQEREVERVGESKRRRVNIRVIAATNRDLFQLVQQGMFRQDLYYRLKVFPIYLPPLRERKDDIPLLINSFIEDQNRKTGKEITGLSHQAMHAVMDYGWPGNVRELENAVEHAFVLCNSRQIELADLPREIRKLALDAKCAGQYDFTPRPKRKPVKLSRRELLRLLEECGWNKAEVARRVGLSRTAIWKYMKKWDIPLRNHT